MDYEAVIGLEVHAQLLTNSKIFCGCPVAFGGEPNSRVCPICLGMPGVLPVLNRRAVEYTIRMALAVEGRVAETSAFARKNYFYPDLPKGYQISQYDRAGETHLPGRRHRNRGAKAVPGSSGSGGSTWRKKRASPSTTNPDTIPT